MTAKFAASTASAIPIHVVPQGDLSGAPDAAQAWANTVGFKGALGSALLVPGSDQQAECVLFGSGDRKSRARSRFAIGAASKSLPAGTYALATELGDADANEFALAWLLSSYSFTRYAGSPKTHAELVAPTNIDAQALEAIAEGECLTRDLINTPSSDMGPQELAAFASDLAERHNAKITVIEDEALVAQNFPMIHTVGRASTRRPRLIDMRWGDSGPTLTLVGKGVCFDTGGLNIKPGGSMGLMKKDMGGAATVLGLAHMIMATNMPVQLRVLIPAVENSIDGNAFRPQDILTSRKGLTVEINNTDAEGRLVLADALTYADEESPDLVISMATLTGAARVAVGADLSPFYTDSDDDAQALVASAARVADPVWRMPFHEPYESMIEPGIADLDNAPKGGFAGSITAALFLRRFLDARYMHFDIYGWQPSAAPARPKGGVGMGARAVFDALPNMLNL